MAATSAPNLHVGDDNMIQWFCPLSLCIEHVVNLFGKIWWKKFFMANAVSCCPLSGEIWVIVCSVLKQHQSRSGELSDYAGMWNMTHWNLIKRSLPRGRRYHLVYYFCLGLCLCFFFVLKCLSSHEETDLLLSNDRNAKRLNEIWFWWD